MALAGFTVGEAEGLRRAMSRKRSEEAIEALRSRFVAGALAQGVDGELANRDLRQARRLLGVRLPEVALGRVRAARLPVGVAAPPLPGRVPLRAAERAADGLLPAGQPRPRRPAARGGGAPARREPERCALRESRTARFASGSATSARSARRRREAVADRAAVRRRRRPGAARAAGERGALDALVASGACDRVRPARASCSGSSVSSPRPASAGLGGDEHSSRSRSSRRRRVPELPEQTDWERMLADYAHDEPLDRTSTRSSCCARTCRRARSRTRELPDASGTARSPSPAWSSPASARRPRTASSSCCSRTSTARST